MKKLPLLFFLALCVVGILLVFRQMEQTKNPSVTIRGKTFAVDVADTNEKRTKGLSGRESLGEREGMFFLFEAPAMLSFWMKDMQFPLDILFIRDGQVLTIHKNVSPPTPGLSQNQLPHYLPREPANMVLEINGGLSDKYGFKEGDAVGIRGLP